MLALLFLLATLNLTAKDNSKTFTVKEHAPIVVTLVSNPSTGYRWQLPLGMGSGCCIRVRSRRYIPPKKGSPAGAAGKEVWTFRTVARGRDTIRLNYARSSRSKAAKRFHVTIRVR